MAAHDLGVGERSAWRSRRADPGGFEDERGHHLRGAGTRRVERHRASCGVHRVGAFAAIERGARLRELVERDLLAPRDIAISVEVRLDPLGDLRALGRDAASIARASAHSASSSTGISRWGYRLAGDTTVKGDNVLAIALCDLRGCSGCWVRISNRIDPSA